ncbi:MAG: tripartite tricarboxylate transporter substrate-binding protein [Vicinamibacterales bacterium]
MRRPGIARAAASAAWCGAIVLGLAAPAAAGPPAVEHLRLVAPAAPGGGWDQTARAMQAALQAAGLVHTSSVENIPGAAGTIGLARFIGTERGSRDVLMLSGLIMLGAVVTHQSPVTLREVTPIARLVGEYEVVVVPAASPIATLADLVAAFRAAPESISWGGGSAGGTDQIVAGLFADAVGVEPRRVNYIAYSGGGESLSAILGGQVTVGVNGLAELAPHIEAGTVRALAISSTERLPEVAIPTFREQGVDVDIENWRSVVAPPGIGVADRQRLEDLVEAMVRSEAWARTLEQYRWNDRYLAGAAFGRFMAAEEARVEGILARLGTGPSAAAAASEGVGAYPVFVLGGLLVTGALSAVGLLRRRAWAGEAPVDPFPAGPVQWLAVATVLGAAVLDPLLLERAGFVVASAVLFWLTARAFDPTRPFRDAIAAVGLSVAAYVLFARLLDIALPAGVLAGVL